MVWLGGLHRPHDMRQAQTQPLLQRFRTHTIPWVGLWCRWGTCASHSSQAMRRLRCERLSTRSRYVRGHVTASVHVRLKRRHHTEQRGPPNLSHATYQMVSHKATWASSSHTLITSRPCAPSYPLFNHPTVVCPLHLAGRSSQQPTHQPPTSPTDSLLHRRVVRTATSWTCATTRVA